MVSLFFNLRTLENHTKTWAFVFLVLLGYCFIRREGLRTLFAKSVWRHSSSILDLKLSLLAAVGWLDVSIEAVETFLLIHFLLPLAPHLCPHIPGEETLQAWANRSPALVRDVWLIILPLVLTDLSFYVAHRLAHKIPLFWRFHKAHHSAETLTPFTAQRSHFLDVLYFRAFHHAASAAALLLTQKVVPGNALFLSAGILLGQWLMRIGNALNHSPIQVTYGRVLGWVFMNSTLHAVHHGRSLHHIDKNFGVLFSFFDRVFSTYYRPAPTESIQLGLSDHSESAYHSLFGFYWTPFRTGSANSRTNQGGRRIVEKKETVLFGHTFLTEE